jgi:hypothetical protein
MVKPNVNPAEDKKVKNVLNTLLVDLLLQDVKEKVKVKLGVKQNDKTQRYIK